MPEAHTTFTGDARDVTAAARQAERAIKTVETSAKTSSKELRVLGASSEAPRKRLVSMANATQLAFGAAGLAYGIKQSVDAFKEAEIQHARVVASLSTVGVANAATIKQIDDVTLAQQRLSGFQDDDLQKSFANIFRVTHDVTGALKLNALAMDISRASGKDLNAVSQAIARVADGNVNALSRYGVKAEKGASSTDVLRLAQQRFAGQAAAFGKTVAGQAEIASGEFNNLQEKIGETFGPLLNQAAGGILSFSSATDTLAQSVGGFGTVFAGAGGFGAVQLAAPLLGRFGKGMKDISILSKVAGGGIKGLGAATAAMVGPLGLVSIGAGLAAAGIYEFSQNSESASQAADRLTTSLQGLAVAQDQEKTATDNAKLAKIDARKADEALHGQQAQNRALHAQVVADNHAEARAVDAATTAKKKHGANSKEYTQAYRDASAATTKADATTKAYTKGLKASGDLAVYAEVAHNRLAAAEKNRANAAGATADADREAARHMTDVINKAKDFAQTTTVAARAGQVLHRANVTAAGSAAIFAQRMREQASSTDKANTSARKTERALADVAEAAGRLPTKKEIRVVQRYVSQGLSLDQIKAKMDLITSKVVTLTTRQVGQPFAPRNAVNPTKPAATGATIAGPFTGIDDTLVLVGSGERILNERQMAMVDSGIPVDTALALTGAPLIKPGGSFQAGGVPVPISTRLSQAGLPPPGRVPVKTTSTTKSSSSGTRTRGGGTKTPTDKRPAWLKHWEDDLGGKLPGEDDYSNRIARLEADLTDAGRTAAKADDVRATHKLIKAARARIDTLHGPKLRGAHSESGKWQQAVNSQISSVGGQLQGYRSGLTDLASKRTSPDDITIDVPSSIRWHIEKATFSEALGDDVSALTEKKNWLVRQLAKKGKHAVKGAKRIAMNRELERTKHELAALGLAQSQAEKQETDEAEAAAGTVPDLPIAVQGILAEAALTPGTDDDWMALKLEEQAIREQLADPRYQDPRAQIGLKNNLAGVLGEIRSLEQGGTGEANAGPTGPTADQQAVLAQTQARLDLATRSAALSEAEVRGLTSSGDIGTGRFGNALGAGVGTPAMLAVLGDQRSLSTLAGAFVQGASGQPAVTSTRSAIRV